MAECYRAGATLQQIGERYGISRQTVQQRLASLGVKAGDRPIKQKPIERERLENLYAQQKLPVKGIAKAFGVDVQTIKKALTYHHIPERKRTRTGSHRREFLKGMKVGDRKEISFSIKRPYKLIYTPAKKLGIRVSMRFIGDDRYEVTRIE